MPMDKLKQAYEKMYSAQPEMSAQEMMKYFSHKAGYYRIIKLK